MYDLLLTEGDLKHILSVIEHRRQTDGRPYCLQIHIEPGDGDLRVVHNTIEPLTREMIAEMRAKGQIDGSEAS